jgi:thiol-disulfide isomerase/thioredoxin
MVAGESNVVPGTGRLARRARVVAVLVVVAVLTTACAAGSSSDSPAAAPAPVVAGDPLDFSATTLAGPELDVSTLAGEPVVLWFWAPWCTICRVEAPDVAAVAADLQGDVTFLGVPGRGPAADMRSFVQDTGTGSLQHLVDADGSVWQRFRVVNQPSFAFVDPDGSVELFAGALGAEQLRARASALAAG